MENKKIIIKILGSGCPNCIKLENNINEAVKNVNLEVVINKITDIETIMSYGVMTTPALIVDNKLICSGRVFGVEEIKTILEEQKQKNNESTCTSCSSGDRY